MCRGNSAESQALAMLVAVIKVQFLWMTVLMAVAVSAIC